MTPPAFAPRIVTCPTCRGPSRYAADNVYRPFCSARCRNNDFGAWATESYRVEASAGGKDDDGGGNHPADS